MTKDKKPGPFDTEEDPVSLSGALMSEVLSAAAEMRRETLRRAYAASPVKSNERPKSGGSQGS
jgi:hypothetical protein